MLSFRAALLALALVVPSAGVSAQAQMTQTGAGGGAGGGPPPSASISFQGFATENVGGTTSNYAGVTFGPAAGNRVLGVCTVGRAAGATLNNVNSMTIGGVAATQVPSALSSFNNEATVDIWYAAVPTGTSGSVVVNWANANARTGIYVYSILTSTPAASAGNAAQIGGSATSIGPINLTVPVQGVGFACLYSRQTGNTQSFTNASTDATNALAGNFQTWSGGTVSGTGVVPITGSSTPTGNDMLMTVGAWGP